MAPAQNENSLWWLHPAWVVGGFSGLVTVMALAAPYHSYVKLWRTPKFMDGAHFWVIVCGLTAFVMGALAARLKFSGWIQKPGRERQPALAAGPLAILFRISFWLCLCGYAVWLGVAVSRGMNWDIVASVLSGKPGQTYNLRDEYLGNITGITTFTQFGIAAAILGTVIAAERGWRSVWAPQLTLLLLAVARCILNSERLAVIELVVPASVTFIGLNVLPRASRGTRLRTLVRLAPMAGSVALYFVFAGFEYFRSWVTFYSNQNDSFWAFAGYRLFGYYVTALNNGAYLMDRLGTPLAAPYFTGNFLWRFPVLNGLTLSLFPWCSNLDDYFNILDAGANAEFNNGGGLVAPMMDFGVYGGLVYWLLAGAVCGGLYRSFQRGSAWGICLYPLVFLSMLDVPRGLYWGAGRAVPAFCFLAVSALVLGVRQRRELAWEVLPRTPWRTPECEPLRTAQRR